MINLIFNAINSIVEIKEVTLRTNTKNVALSGFLFSLWSTLRIFKFAMFFKNIINRYAPYKDIKIPINNNLYLL